MFENGVSSLSRKHDADRIENTVSNNSMVPYVFVAAVTYLQNSFLAMAVSSGSTIDGGTDIHTASWSHKPPDIFQNRETMKSC
jgi:hypothetical protein